jgi:hypothetical protein
MTKYKIKLRNVQNVGDSKTVLIDCHIGKRYHYIVIQLAYSSGTNTVAGAVAHFTNLRVKINGRTQRNYAQITSNGSAITGGQVLRDLNINNGTAYDMTGVPNTGDGVSFPLYFNEPWRKDAADQDAPAWATSGWNSLQIEIDMSAAIASSGSPAIVAYAVVDDLQVDKQQGIVKVLKVDAPAGGKSFDITTIDKKDYLQQVTLYPDSGGSSNTFTEVDLRINGQIWHELSQTANTALITNYAMTPAASGRTSSLYDLVADHDDLLGSSVLLTGVADLVLTDDQHHERHSLGVRSAARIAGLINRSFTTPRRHWGRRGNSNRIIFLLWTIQHSQRAQARTIPILFGAAAC